MWPPETALRGQHAHAAEQHSRSIGELCLRSTVAAAAAAMICLLGLAHSHEQSTGGATVLRHGVPQAALLD